MPFSGFLYDLSLVLGASGLATLLCRQFKQPVVIGYIITGFPIGPHLTKGTDGFIRHFENHSPSFLISYYNIHTRWVNEFKERAQDTEAKRMLMKTLGRLLLFFLLAGWIALFSAAELNFFSPRLKEFASMRPILIFTVSTLLGLIAVPAAADFGPSDTAATDTAETAAAVSVAVPAVPASGKARHFSIHYNMLRSSFEARFLPNDRWYIAFVPLIIGEGNNNPDSEGSFLPNLHFDQAFSAYGYVSLLELNPVSWVTLRGGLEIQDRLYFVEAGLRIRFLPFDRWAFELSTYPMQASYQTVREWSNITLFQRSNMNLGLEFLF